MNIEKNIPIPARGRSGKWQQLGQQMDINDSVLLTAKEANCFRFALTSSGFKVVTRAEGDNVRVWKTEAENVSGA